MEEWKDGRTVVVSVFDGDLGVKDLVDGGKGVGGRR